MSRSAFGRAALAAAAMLGAALARTAGADEAALLLADEAPTDTGKASDWRTFLEAAAGGAVLRPGNATADSRRLSLDIQYDRSLAPDWRVLVANRLDMNWPSPAGSDRRINTLKEAYVSWWALPDAMLDMGRINERHGVATGYNPTDYFRGGALCSIVSISPASLKENRQGSIMLRGQRLWLGGSLTMLYSPQLDRQPSAHGLSLDIGATNPRHRGLVAVSQKIGAALAPEFLIYREEAQPAQFGLNLTGLINDATVAHLEWSGGRGPALLAQALDRPAALETGSVWRNRLATGLAYATASKVKLTAEYHFNGAGLDRVEWNALRQGPAAVYGRYRGWVQARQEPPTRQALFFHATWRDAVVNRLDFSLMHNVDLADSSRRTWWEARYHLDRIEYALQWQCSGGQQFSNFGALSESRGWQAVMRYYL